MFINFAEIYHFFFKSFDISKNIKTLENLKNDWINSFLLLKQSFYYLLILSCIILFFVPLIVLNILILAYDDFNTIEMFICAFLVLDIVYFLVISFLFLYNSKKIFWYGRVFWNYSDLYQKILNWNKNFEKFFNQSMFCYILLFFLSIYMIVNVFILFFDGEISLMDFWLWTLSAFIFFVQLYLIFVHRKKIINFELNFYFVYKGNIFINKQDWLNSTVYNLSADKIKTFEFTYPPKFFAKLFNYWDINILTEWDTNWISTTKFMFVQYDDQIISEIINVLKVKINTTDDAN